MEIMSWNDQVLQYLKEIRNNGTPQGSAEGLNLQVLGQNVNSNNPVPIADAGASITVDGSVSISNFPTTQQVNGQVSISNFPTTQPVSGSISVANFPTTQPVSGSISVANFPTFQLVQGVVSITNLPDQPYDTYEDFGTATSGVANPLPGRLMSLLAHNHSTACTRYFQLFDSNQAPSTGDVPKLYFPVCSGNSWLVDSSYFGCLGRTFTQGIAWGWSNTPKTYSAVQSPSEHSTFINYL